MLTQKKFATTITSANHNHNKSWWSSRMKTEEKIDPNKTNDVILKCHCFTYAYTPCLRRHKYLPRPVAFRFHRHEFTHRTSFQTILIIHVPRTRALKRVHNLMWNIRSNRRQIVWQSIEFVTVVAAVVTCNRFSLCSFSMRRWHLQVVFPYWNGTANEKLKEIQKKTNTQKIAATFFFLLMPSHIL